MPRRKLTDEEKQARAEKRKLRIEEEEKKRREDHMAFSLRSLQENQTRRIEFGSPTHTFEVGERVCYGSHDNTEVLEVVDGMFYKIHNWGEKPVYGKPTKYEDVQWVEWAQLEPFRTVEELETTPIFSYRDAVRLSFSNSSITGVLYHHRSTGVDMDPDYQRDHVWTDEHRRLLIDSIFNNVDIGKFVFRDLGYKETGPMYEIIDGKQRLTTLILFDEGRLTWKGRTIFELHPRDQHHFRDYQVQSAMIKGPVTKAQIYDVFLKLNTGGVAQDPKHLAAVRARLKELTDQSI